ncbi:hypothetical protein GOV04_01235 [Candidatus Woesearchaeota archaeon]|nr:hypothetical protein [Candidatus Woesearchaeota archaeon]
MTKKKLVKQRMKPLMPTLKEKKRYIKYRIHTQKPLSDNKMLQNTVRGALQEYLGSSGAAKAGLLFVKDGFDVTEQTFIIRVNNKQADNVKASLTLKTKMNNKEVNFQSIKTSAILKKLIKGGKK